MSSWEKYWKRSGLHVPRIAAKYGWRGFLPEIRTDIAAILRRSAAEFGQAAAERYSALISQALRDVQSDPERPGANARPDLAPDAYVYHLSFSRGRVTGGRVKAPRHFLLYRFSGHRVEFARVLHDSRDLARHLQEDDE